MQWYQNKKQLINYYNIKWIRSNCSENVLDRIFLICMGVLIHPRNQLKPNNNLFEKLNQITEYQKI